MPRSLDFEHLVSRFRSLLIAQGPLNALEAYSLLGISQASFSRLVDRMRPDLISFGRARKTRYTLRKTIPTLGTQAPLYAISEQGRPVLLGNLHFLEPRGFCLESQNPELSERCYPGLPYFLEDLRPSGFLGRLVPRAHPGLGAPADILTWSTEDCLRYWTSLGWNLVGNLLLGKNALQIFLAHQQELIGSSQDRNLSPSKYPEYARAILAQGDVGSSAGGEQPKFMLEASPSGPASLVKFSPPLDNPIGQRVADLLICEHLCHELLSARGFASARSKILREQNQIFLEVERFDRVGTAGRRGLISLRALSLEFVGTLDSWSEIARGLVREKLISTDVLSRIRELEVFGELIGNTDMHPGNLSFHIDEKLQLIRLAPVYDMLPMMYYPRQNQLPQRTYQPRLPLPEEAEIWKRSCSMALEFWQQASKDKRISPDFRKIARENRAHLETQAELAARIFPS